MQNTIKALYLLLFIKTIILSDADQIELIATCPDTNLPRTRKSLYSFT